jgi:hypothetical protein
MTKAAGWCHGPLTKATLPIPDERRLSMSSPGVMAAAAPAGAPVIERFPAALAADPAPAPALQTRRQSRAISLLRYAPWLVLILVILTDAEQCTDPDLWGHLHFGQGALLNHGPFRADPYSYSALGHPWLNHEWGTEVVMALFYNHFGVVGLKLWKFACAGATIGFVVLGLAETGASPGVQFSTLAFAAVALMPQMQFRPQLFTFMFFAALLALLARHHYRGSAPVWLAVPIMMLWGNLHGGYIIGIATLGTYTAIVGMQDFRAGRGLRRALPLAVITILGTFATLLSPYGIDNWLVVLNALRLHVSRSVIGDWTPLMRATIDAWRQHDGSLLIYAMVIGVIVAFAVSIALQPAGGDLPLVVLGALMSLAAFAAVRNMPLAVIACTLPFARHTSLLVDRIRARAAALGTPLPDPPRHSTVNPWFAGALALTLVLHFGLFSRRLEDDRNYPSGAIAFMQQHDLHGNVLVDFNWAQYFIWHAPESKVFIDGRNDSVYPLKILDQYLDYYFARGDAHTVLQSYPHQFVLIPPKSKADGVMTKTPDWKLVYKDSDAALYARSDTRAAQSAATPMAGPTPRQEYFP